ncbi:hypothetical protein [Arthrobacter sp. NPDC090010]|uniref:hypothetical protein n=1 Tax=Arthrobacter sp. NPDC090010 TaxID=3363942 RepID=UPI00380AA324
MLLRTLPPALGRLVSVAAVTVASLGAIAMPLATVPAAQAAPQPSNDKAWGPDGSFASDSAVTVRWDNKGNAPENTVARERATPLPHTAGKSYADIPARIRNSVQSLLGPDNGRGGLSMTVSQSKDLVNQVIGIRLDGLADPSPGIGGGESGDQFQLFQCWGAPGPNGKPDPAAQAPDPSTCELGAAGWGQRGSAIDGPTTFAQQIGGDPLLAGGDWERGGLIDQDGYLKVMGIDGSLVSGYPLTSPVINQNSTNEVSRLYVNKTGTASVPFEVHTTTEAKFMGCGKREDAPSTSDCWLVAVPKVGQLQGAKAASPSAWAQRLQVKIKFRDIPKPCSSTQQRLLSSGSEVLAPAAASWIPALCGQGQGFALAKVADSNARVQQAGGNPLAFTSQPSSGAEHTPVALAGVSIGYRVGLTDVVDGKPQSAGLVTGLKLNARLLAKLLTSSYSQANLVRPQPPGYDSPFYLSYDPEFLRLNPQLNFDKDKPPYLNLLDNRNFNLELLNSDAAQVVWKWLASDPAAASFLNGCPDPDGMTVQPFYSTRSYVGCESQAKALETKAAAQRAAAVKLPEFVDGPQIYPPYSAAYPQVLWTQGEPGLIGEAKTAPQTLPDAFPRVDNMAIAGQRTSRMTFVQNIDYWCDTVVSLCPVPPPGKWQAQSSKSPRVGTSSVFGITDTATAANYQLQTALLCDDSGKVCVGADESSLTKASSAFTTEAAPQPDPVKALDAGGYPLTMPVYAALKSGAKATPDVVKQIDTVINYMTGPGQKPGFGVGQLPPGYAPITAAMKAQATCALATFKGERKPGCSSGAPVESKPGGSGSLIPDVSRPANGAQGPLTPLLPNVKGDGGAANTAAEPTDAGAAAGQPAPDGSKSTQQADAASPVSNGVTAVTPAAWASYGLFVLLGLGLVASIASPILKRLRGGGEA